MLQSSCEWFSNLISIEVRFHIEPLGLKMLSNWFGLITGLMGFARSGANCASASVTQIYNAL